MAKLYDTEAVPKFFWYCVSVAMLAATCVVLLLAWRSSTLSIEFANAKISIQQAAGSVQSSNRLRFNTIDTAKRIETHWENGQMSDKEAVTSLVSLMEEYGEEVEQQTQELMRRLEITAENIPTTAVLF